MWPSVQLARNVTRYLPVRLMVMRPVPVDAEIDAVLVPADCQVANSTQAPGWVPFAPPARVTPGLDDGSPQRLPYSPSWTPTWVLAVPTLAVRVEKAAVLGVVEPIVPGIAQVPPSSRAEFRLLTRVVDALAATEMVATVRRPAESRAATRVRPLFVFVYHSEMSPVPTVSLLPLLTKRTGAEPTALRDSEGSSLPQMITLDLKVVS